MSDNNPSPSPEGSMMASRSITSIPEEILGSGEHGTGPAPVTQVIEERSEQQYIPCFFRYITALARTWALITIGVLWTVTVSIIGQKQNFTYTPWYLLAVSIVITLFELIWILDKCVSKFRDDGCFCCCRVWRAFVWIDNWKKATVYTLLAVPCFLEGIAVWQAILCGLFILISAFLYFMKSFRDSKCIHRKKQISKYTRITNMEAGKDYGATVQDRPEIKVTPAQNTAPPTPKPVEPDTVGQPDNSPAPAPSGNPFDSSSGP